MSRNIPLPYMFEPRDYQMGLFKARERGVSRMLCVWHRRAGKDKALINLVARECFRRVGAYYYYFPTAVWARKAIWQGMDKDGFPFMGHFPKDLVAKTHDREMMLELVNGSIFQIIGTDTLDVVGVNPLGCVFSEYSLQNPKAWQYITPILNENEGWAAFNFTPRGKNHDYQLYNQVKDNPDWYCELLGIRDTGRIKLEVVERDIKDGMISRELAEQEYHCSFDYGMEGSVFGEYIRRSRSEGRIGSFKHDPMKEVLTFWDLGVSDAMTIWFGQVREDGSIWMVDFMSENNKGLDWFSAELKKKPYRYGGHFAPHDAAKREITSGTSIIATANRMGLPMELVQRTSSIEADVELCRRLFGRFSFDEEKCGPEGLIALGDFRRDQDTGKPVMTDWTSHAVDAFRTCCRALELGMVRNVGERMEYDSGRKKRQEKTISDYDPLAW